MHEINSVDGKTIAIVVKSDFSREGVNFISKEDFPLQLGISSYKQGERIKSHFHLNKDLTIKCVQEVVHLESGHVVVDLYDLDGEKVESVELTSGDTIFFVNGGHGFLILENTKLIEVKQGPYDGKNKDKRMIE